MRCWAPLVFIHFSEFKGRCLFDVAHIFNLELSSHSAFAIWTNFICVSIRKDVIFAFSHNLYAHFLFDLFDGAFDGGFLGGTEGDPAL